MLTAIRWWGQPPARSTQFLKMWKESRYILQLSFQSMPGVTTMAISAEIYPSMVRGTGAGISAACGKVGATVGSYSFSELKLVAIQGWCCFVAFHRILAFCILYGFGKFGWYNMDLDGVWMYKTASRCHFVSMVVFVSFFYKFHQFVGWNCDQSNLKSIAVVSSKEPRAH